MFLKFNTFPNFWVSKQIPENKYEGHRERKTNRWWKRLHFVSMDVLNTGTGKRRKDFFPGSVFISCLFLVFCCSFFYYYYYCRSDCSGFFQTNKIKVKNMSGVLRRPVRTNRYLQVWVFWWKPDEKQLWLSWTSWRVSLSLLPWRRSGNALLTRAFAPNCPKLPIMHFRRPAHSVSERDNVDVETFSCLVKLQGLIYSRNELCSTSWAVIEAQQQQTSSLSECGTD